MDNDQVSLEQVQPGETDEFVQDKKAATKKEVIYPLVMPGDMHKKLKIKAAIEETTIRSLLLQAVQKVLEE